MDYKKDYYSILGVDDKATPEALRASYRRLARLHHPDKNPGDPDAEERFKVINEAYEVLSNEITRHIYDDYRTSNKKEGKSRRPDNSVHSHEPLRRTTKKTYNVVRENRIYVYGTIEVKFQGEPALSDTYLRQWEQRYTIFPTEVLATIISSDIYKDGPPKEYQSGYSTAELFSTPLKQPVNCKIVTAGQEEYYQLDLYDIRVKDPVLKDVTRHEQYSFGTLRGNLFGYTLHRYEEEITEEHAEYYGATGHVETKAESGYIFTRQQFYAADGATYWAEWKRGPVYAGKSPSWHGEVKPVFRNDNRESNWSWVIVLLVVVAIWPRLLYAIVPLVVVWLILLLIGWSASVFHKILPWLSTLVIGIILLLAVQSFFYESRTVLRTTSNHKFDNVSSTRTVIQGLNKESDTIITHNLRWEDRDSNRFDIQLSVPLSELRKSALAHEQMDEQQYALRGIGAVYRSLLDTDNDYIRPLAARFDSLAKVRSLDRQREASMVVSCIQSIPYSLIVNRSCSDSYTDSYINQYLSHCEGDCCKGYSKFGVQSPVEFIGDLKGDCDTRALLLYDLLGKLGFKVALMTSNYYKHALIAVALDRIPSDADIAININGKPYYLWETTAKGFGPGQLPDALSNINHWNVELTQQ